MNMDEKFYQADTFEKKMKILLPQMSEDTLKKSAEQVAHMCKCCECPSYQETGEQRQVFCNVGKSVKIQEQRGCLCQDCPNSKMMLMRWDYYCLQGKAWDLAEREKTTNSTLPLLGKLDKE